MNNENKYKFYLAENNTLYAGGGDDTVDGFTCYGNEGYRFYRSEFETFRRNNVVFGEGGNYFIGNYGASSFLDGGVGNDTLHGAGALIGGRDTLEDTGINTWVHGNLLSVVNRACERVWI